MLVLRYRSAVPAVDSSDPNTRPDTVNDAKIEPIPLKPGSTAPEHTIEAVLQRLCAGTDARISLGELLAKLDSRAYGFVLLLLAAPNLTPGPSIPGFSTVFGLPAIVFAVQMLLGHRQPWLPARLARITLPRQRLANLITRALPTIMRVDRMLRPRLPALTGRTGQRLTGLSCLVQGALLTLPIPIFSIAPALAILLIAIGMIGRDGLVAALGHGTGVAIIGTTVGLSATILSLFGI